MALDQRFQHTPERGREGGREGGGGGGGERGWVGRERVGREIELWLEVLQVVEDYCTGKINKPRCPEKQILCTS